MTIIDWILVGALAISALFGIKRGFVSEVLSLVTWVLAFVVARLFATPLASLLEGTVETGSLRLIIAFIILFLGCVIVGVLVSNMLRSIVHATGLGGVDRVLGMGFGVLRGMVILVAVVFGLQLTVVPNDEWWQNSLLIPYLSSLADWAQQTLPGAAMEMMSFTSKN